MKSFSIAALIMLLAPVSAFAFESHPTNGVVIVTPFQPPAPGFESQWGGRRPDFDHWRRLWWPGTVGALAYPYYPNPYPYYGAGSVNPYCSWVYGPYNNYVWSC